MSQKEVERFDDTITASEWIPWKVKEGRPDAIPGCHNLESLSTLGDNNSCCEGQYCYYFRCRKCLPLLSLDYLNPEHKDNLVILPDINSIKPKEPSLFAADYGYLGEVVEFYHHYISHMKKLKGFAINGWNNKIAKEIFDNVESTFVKSKNKQAKDFEVDWMLMNGSVLTIVEVGMRGDTEGRNENTQEDNNGKKGKKTETDKVERVISSKIDQIIKHDLIIKHLLEATNNQLTSVNYFLMLPDFSIDQVETRVRNLYRRALKEGREYSLDKLTNSNNSIQFGVIPSEAIAEKTVYFYSGNGEFSQPIHFETLNQPQSDQEWEDNYRYLTSILVTSCLLTSNPKSSPNPKPEKSLLASQLSERDRKSMYPSVGWTQKKTGPRFPTQLVLGPEQLRIVNSSEQKVSKKDKRAEKLQRNITFLIGEAGCGKTTTLLALLFKYTGKHVSPSKNNLRKVVFFIPQEKTEFRKDVKKFVADHCRPEWVQISPLHLLLKEELIPECIYLIDEFYGSTTWIISKLKWKRCKTYIASVSSKSAHGVYMISNGSWWHCVYFRRTYRSPEVLSRVSSKLRRLIDRENVGSSRVSLPWAMSFYNGAPANSKNIIHVINFEKFMTSGESILHSEKRNLVVSVDIDSPTIQFIEQKFNQSSRYYLSSESKSVESIPFTGSEFQNVMVVLGDSVSLDNSTSILLLHCAITRATENAYVICQKGVESKINSILSLSETNDIIFERLRCGSYIGTAIMSQAPKDRLEMLKRILVTNNRKQFECIERSLRDTDLTTEERQMVKFMKLMSHSFTMEDMQIVIEPLEILNDFEWSSSSRKSAILEGANLFPRIGVEIPSDLEIPEHILSTIKDKPTLTSAGLKHAFDLVGSNGQIDSLGLVRKLFRKHPEQAEFLLEYVDVDKVERITNFLLNLLPQSTGHLVVCAKATYFNWKRLRLDIKRKVMEKEANGTTFFHHLALRNGPKFMKRMINYLPNGMSLTDDVFLDNSCQNPLMAAAGNAQNIGPLVEREKEHGDLRKLLTHRDKYGWSCLRWACRFGSLDAVKSLIFHGADWADDMDPDGRTLLHLLCVTGHNHVLSFLLKLDSKQADPYKVAKTKDAFGLTCLHCACFFGRPGAVNVILGVVPDLQAETFLGINCLTISKSCIFEDKASLIDLFEQTLEAQHLDEDQEAVIRFSSERVFQVNFNAFIDTFEEMAVIKRLYLKYVPCMIVMAIFNVP